MKKFFAIVMALCMLLMTAALAEGATELNWADIEPVLEAGEVAGEFKTFDEIAVKIWIPEGINAVELSDEDKANGYVGYFQAEDQSGTLAVMYVDTNGMSIDDYADYLAGESDVTEVEKATVNGLPCVTYEMPGQDTASIAFATEAGYVLEVTCNPISDENAQLVWGCVFASIQAA